MLTELSHMRSNLVSAIEKQMCWERAHHCLFYSEHLFCIQQAFCSHHLQHDVIPAALVNPETSNSETSSLQFENLNRETSGDTKNAFLRWGDVIGVFNRGGLMLPKAQLHRQALAHNQDS